MAAAAAAAASKEPSRTSSCLVAWLPSPSCLHLGEDQVIVIFIFIVIVIVIVIVIGDPVLFAFATTKLTENHQASVWNYSVLSLKTLFEHRAPKVSTLSCL